MQLLVGHRRIVRGWVDAFNDRDVERFVSLFAADATFRPGFTSSPGGMVHGHAALRSWATGWFAQTTDWRVAVRELHALSVHGFAFEVTITPHGAECCIVIETDDELIQTAATHLTDWETREALGAKLPATK